MPTKDELVENINAMAAEVTEALGHLENNEDVDLDGIEPRVREAMEAVADLPPDDAISMRPILVDLLEKMEHFGEVLQEKIDELAADAANAPSDDAKTDD